MKFIAHMGLPKTGSSAVQAWLMRRSADLAEHGIVAPMTFCGDHGNCVALIEALLDPADTPSPLINALSDVFEQARVTNPRAIMISSEEFGHYMRYPGQLARIQSQFAKFGQPLDEGVVFLRNPQDMLNSSYAQIVKVAPFPMTFDAFVDYWNGHRVFNFDRNFANLRAAGIAVRAGVFRPGASMTERTLRLAGLDDAVPADFDYSTPRQNESIGEIGVILARLIWAMTPFDTLAPASHARVATEIVRACGDIKDRAFNGFTQQSLHESTAYFAPILEAVRSELPDEDHAALLLNRLEKAPTSRNSVHQLSVDEHVQVQAALDQIAGALGDLLTPAQADAVRAAAG